MSFNIESSVQFSRYKSSAAKVTGMDLPLARIEPHSVHTHQKYEKVAPHGSE